MGGEEERRGGTAPKRTTPPLARIAMDLIRPGLHHRSGKPVVIALTGVKLRLPPPIIGGGEEKRDARVGVAREQARQHVGARMVSSRYAPRRRG